MTGRGEMDKAYDDAWSAFVRAGTTEPVFGLGSSKEVLHLVFLLPVGHHQHLGARVAPLQRSLASPYADLVPAQRLHVSIQGIDVEPSYWHKHHKEVLDPAREVFSCCPSFTMRLGWANSFSMAAFLRAEDDGMIHWLRAKLRAALPAWAALDRDPLIRNGRDEWLPHMSIAYYNARHDNRALVDAILPLRSVVIADVQVQGVDLISTPSDPTGSNRWAWPLHARFALGEAVT